MYKRAKSGFHAGKEIYFKYDEFLRESSLSERNVVDFLMDGSIDFCVRIPPEMRVFVFDYKSTPVADDIRGRFGYGRKFEKTVRAPKPSQTIFYLVVSRDDARSVISGKVIYKSEFYYGYDEMSGACVFFDDDFRIKPSMGVFDGVERWLFFGLNQIETTHDFSESEGYAPRPVGIEIRKESLLIRGRIFERLYNGRKYKEVVSGGLMKNCARNIRNDSLSLEIEQCIRDIRGSDGVGLVDVYPRQIISRLGALQGKEGSCIKEITGTVIHWWDGNGDERKTTFEALRSRLRRFRNAAPIEPLKPKFFEGD